MHSFRCRYATICAVLLAGAPSHAALAQSWTKTGISPAAPPTLNAPVFDTRTPVYGKDGSPQARQTIVADVNGRAITLGEVIDAMDTLPPGVAGLDFSDRFDLARRQLVARMAVVLQAEAQGLDKDPPTARRIREATNAILADAYVRREATKSITDPELRARYDRDIANRPAPDELHLRIIAAATKAEAEEALGQLRAGGDFAALARRLSKDQSAGAGGDVGFVTPIGLAPELAAAALALTAGQTAANPIPSNGHWFVLRVEDRRPGTPLPFAAVRDQIERQLIQERAPDLARQALSGTILRLYSIDGREVEGPTPAPEQRKGAVN